MSDKPIAILVTAAAIAPLCAICVLGPAFLGGAVAWVSGWVGGLGPAITTGLVLAVGVAVFRAVRRERQRHRPVTGPHHSRHGVKRLESVD
jgi:hypothetical protein